MKRIIIILLPFVFIQLYQISEAQTVYINVRPDIVNPQFGGVGFHVFYHVHNAPQWHYDQIFAKRWRELNPSFVRINDDPTWSIQKLDSVAHYLDVMKSTGTEMYFNSWNTAAIKNYKDEREYVKNEVDHLEYLKKDKGFNKLNYYCMANELSLDKWASMVNDLDYFKKVQGLFYDEIGKRNLGIKMLATDASPISYWHTIEWAAKNMDNITGVYGGHHYINDYDLFDEKFYNFFYTKMKWGADLARSKGKNFIVGEFGAKQNSNEIDGVRHDAMIYNNTPLEKYIGIQVGEAIIAMMNAGVYGCNYWTFSDFPSSYRKDYINKWGLFRWEVDNFTTKPSYYAIGLLTKFFRGPSQAYAVKTTDSLCRVAAIKNVDDGSVSIAIINRRGTSRPINLDLKSLDIKKPLRKYVYDPADVPFNYFGDLQTFSKIFKVGNGRIADSIPAMSLVVYTNHYDNDPPAAVTGLKTEHRKIDNRDRRVLTWDENKDADFCYYRIYRSEKTDVEISELKQIASTISNEYMDMSVHNMPEYYYAIVAVDQSGNRSNASVVKN